MKTNMNPGDKAIRIVTGTTFIVLCTQGVVTGTVATVLLIMAALLLIITSIGICPLYLLFGLSTCKTINKHGTSRN